MEGKTRSIRNIVWKLRYFDIWNLKLPIRRPTLPIVVIAVSTSSCQVLTVPDMYVSTILPKLGHVVYTGGREPDIHILRHAPEPPGKTSSPGGCLLGYEPSFLPSDNVQHELALA